MERKIVFHDVRMDNLRSGDNSNKSQPNNFRNITALCKLVKPWMRVYMYMQPYFNKQTWNVCHFCFLSLHDHLYGTLKTKYFIINNSNKIYVHEKVEVTKMYTVAGVSTVE